MRISQVIKQLEAIKVEHGDLPVAGAQHKYSESPFSPGLGGGGGGWSVHSCGWVYEISVESSGRCVQITSSHQPAYRKPSE